MSLKVTDLADKKTYLVAVQKHAKAANGRFFLYESKFEDGSKGRMLVFGAHLALLRKHLEARKAALLDDGAILDGGIFLAQRGKFTDKMLADLKLDGIVQVKQLGGKTTLDMDAKVPSINMTVRDLLADLADRQGDVTKIVHPKLQADAEQLCRQITGWVKAGKFQNIDKEYTALQQIQVDARVAEDVAGELAQVEAPLKARNRKEELDALKTAQAYYDAGQFAPCRAELRGIHKLLGPMPYGPKSGADDQKWSDAVKRLGSRAAVYADEKDKLETQIGKVLGNRAKLAAYVKEAQAVKAFLDKSASLGLRKQVEAIEREHDDAKRKRLVEKTIVVVQAYITAFVRQVNDAPQIGKDYLAALRQLHAELTALHHSDESS